MGLMWQAYQHEVMTMISPNKAVIRAAKTVADLEPTCSTLYRDDRLTLNGYYNKRGYCVGYSLEFSEEPEVMLRDFFLVVDYLGSDECPKKPTNVKLPKKDSKICFVRNGEEMYTFIYRKKRDV